MAGSTQNQAFSALLLLYKEVLKIELKGVAAKRAKVKKNLPVVLSRDEIRRVLEHAREGTPHLRLSLLYGCGLRVSEGLRLRVKDVDFPNGTIWVRAGKAEIQKSRNQKGSNAKYKDYYLVSSNDECG